MPASIRIGDPVSCGDTMAQGSPDVFANSIPHTRISIDNTAGHCYAPTPISSASPDTFINNKNAVRVGDPIIPHTCSPIPATHGGNMAAGSPNVYINSGGGAGAIIDNNPPFSTPGIDPPPGANPGNPDITTADVHVFEENDDPDGPLGGPPSGTTQVPLVEVEDDPTPAPTNPPPSQDCSDVDSLPASFTWTTAHPSYNAFATSFALSPNFRASDMSYAAVSYYEFTAAVNQANGDSQKTILGNMCHHAKTILEPLLADGNVPTMNITSAFRNKTGGSQHNRGQATDIQFPSFHGSGSTGQQYFDLAKYIRDNFNFDQMILEWFGRNPWIHISTNPSSHRNIVLTQTSSNSYAPGLKLLRKS